MDYNIRNSVFETNSSSVHVLAIPKKTLDEIKIPDSVEFCLGQFGTESEIYTDVCSRASYLYTLIYSEYYDDYSDDENERVQNCDKFFDAIGRLEATLYAHGVTDVSFEYVEYYVPGDSKKSYFNIPYDCWYYIDHSDHLGEWFIEHMLENSELLLRFLFGNTIIETGYGNNGTAPSVDNYDNESYDAFKKGN